MRSLGNLKFDVPPLKADPDALARLAAAIGGRPTWVAASTYEREEEIVAAAHRLIRQRHPDALTIIVPRHPERGEAVRAMLAASGLTVAQRSRGNPLLREIDVYIADTLGELGLFYRLAPIAFLGGSLVPHGGQNPIEPTPTQCRRVTRTSRSQLRRHLRAARQSAAGSGDYRRRHARRCSQPADGRPGGHLRPCGQGQPGACQAERCSRGNDDRHVPVPCRRAGRTMIRTAPAFWWRAEMSAAAMALAPVARIWSAGAAWRMTRQPQYRPPVPVICIGNFVVGGAGKTPTAIALARIARGRGLRPGLLASGYGGSNAGPLLVDAAHHNADEVGDEALLLAAAAPTVIARDRAAGAHRLVAEGIDLIVMDDGFQNPSVAKDLSLVAVDATVGIGNGRVVPAGPLRAPLKLQLRRAGALVVIGDGKAAEPLVRAAARAGRAILRGRLRPAKVRDWRKEPILAFAGIGRPDKFFATLAEARAPVAHAVGFPDHHRYSDAEAAELLATAEAEKLRLVTTEKDMVRLAGRNGPAGTLCERAEAFQVILEFENPTAIGETIDGAVRAAALAV